MSGGKININVSGGNANFGNISQGDQNINTVGEQSISANVEEAFGEFFSHIESLSTSSKIRDDEMSSLRNEIASLKESLESKQESGESLGQIAKSFYENYGWAADALKKLFFVLIP